MSLRASQVQTRADVFQAQGVLRVVRAPLPAAPPAPGQPGFVYSQADRARNVSSRCGTTAASPRCTVMWIWAPGFALH